MISTAELVQHDEQNQRSPRRWPGKLGTPLLICALVAVLAQLPTLRDRFFFFRDDAATQMLPMWFHLGERVRAGHWPPLLDLQAWMGGNLAVETLFGVWNPVNAAMWVFVSLMPNLAVTGIVLRTVAFMLLALGVYGVCREYGAARWAASVCAVALAFCGPLFYFDAAVWPAAMFAFVWIPYLWWVARRAARGRTNVIWVFVVGALGVTSGNPYAMLGVCVVLVAVLAETLVMGYRRAAMRMLLTSATVACVVPLVYFPLLLSKHMTWRTESMLSNSGFLAPGISDLLGLSDPGFLPEVDGIGSPATYLCWFVVPLAAWLNWRALADRARDLTGVFVVAGVFLLLGIGPTDFWMFRWPIRMLHYGYLGVIVLLAVVLTAGLRTDFFRRRVIITSVVLGFLYYLGWASAPEFPKRNLISVLVLAGLAAAVIALYRSGRRVSVMFHVGTVVCFALQLFWFLPGSGPTPYYFPASVDQARANLGQRYQGQTLQIADHSLLGEPTNPRQAWKDVVPGNMYLPTGVDSINSYTGMGYHPFSENLCLNYDGSTCPEAYPALWKTPKGATVPLAELLRLDTVVVQDELVENPHVPPGWKVDDRAGRVTVVERQAPHAWPEGRLSWASAGTEVTADRSIDDSTEVVRFQRQDGPGRMVFARLAWPGYQAEVDGRQVPAYAGPAGLLEVRLPEGVDQGELRLTWTPPRYKASLAFAAVGLAGALALGFTQRRRGVRP